MLLVRKVFQSCYIRKLGTLLVVMSFRLLSTFFATNFIQFYPKSK